MQELTLRKEKKNFDKIQADNLSVFVVILKFLSTPHKVGLHNQLYSDVLPMLEEWSEDICGNFPSVCDSIQTQGLVDENFNLTPKGEAQAMKSLSASLRSDSDSINFAKLVRGKSFGYLLSLVTYCMKAMEELVAKGFVPNENYNNQLVEISDSFENLTYVTTSESSII